jgi:hypothetical protein
MNLALALWLNDRGLLLFILIIIVFDCNLVEIISHLGCINVELVAILIINFFFLFFFKANFELLFGTLLLFNSCWGGLRWVNVINIRILTIDKHI